MFESTRDSHVYKYQDMFSKSIKCISIEDIDICEWKHAKTQKTSTTSNKKVNPTLPKILLYNANRKDKKQVN